MYLVTRLPRHPAGAPLKHDGFRFFCFFAKSLPRHPAGAPLKREEEERKRREEEVFPGILPGPH